MSQSKPIRIGVIGAGTNTKAKHLPLLQEIEGVTVHGVVNRSEASSTAVAGEFGIQRIYTSWEEAVDDPNTDAIVIGTWPYLHCPITLRSFNNGKHVLTEARMAMNASEAQDMLSTSNQHPHLVAQVVPSPITLGVDQTIKHLLKSGAIGSLLTIECRHGGDFLAPDAPLHWRQDITKSGLNIMAMGIYYEAIMRWVGPATKITARGKIFTKTRINEKGESHSIQVPEHVDVLADLASGAQLHLQESSTTPLRSEEEGIRITGSDGVLLFRGGILLIAKRGDSQFHPLPLSSDRVGSWRVEEEFIGAIRRQEPITHTTFEDGLRYMEFTEAVHRSMREEKSIGLPLDTIGPSK
ncbi:Gfo/Idh/MocA family oxidoreductase [bacterium]|nr:Gfo/Idh/MocA family oxidoreductase [Verrucomicrobiota bacterium]MDA7633375.1 Gfo/Idh/MocA family oxidoreductase [bacterium]